MTIMKKNKVKLIVNDSNNLILNKLRKKTEVILLKIKKIRKWNKKTKNRKTKQRK